MLDLTTFDYDSQAVRTVMIDGAPWFVAVDVCRILDLQNPTQVLLRLDEDEKGLYTVDTLGGPQSLNVVSESGLYALIFTSRKAEAKAFRKWVTSVVLPSLRREGVFVMGQDTPHPDIGAPSPAFGFDMARQDVSNWLAIVREARLLKGPKTAARIWDASPLATLVGDQVPDVMTQTRAAVDDVAAFVGDAFDITGSGYDRIPAREMIGMYRQWRADHGLAAMTDAAMAKAIAATSQRYVCPRTGQMFTAHKAGTMFYVGLRARV